MTTKSKKQAFKSRRDKMLTLEVFQTRRDQLSSCLTTSEVDLELLKERMKVIKKEIANTKGAILEIDHIIEAHY